MDLETRFAQATELLQPWIRWSQPTQSDLLTVSISRQHLLDAVQALTEQHWGYLSAITGLHIPAAEGETSSSFVVLYAFCSGPAVLHLRVHPPSEQDATVPSVCGIIPSATLYERELQEMYGVTVTGTPDNSRLLLPEDWPDGVYPLRKDFHGLPERAAEA